MIEKLCPVCRAAPLREVTEGVFRCVGCRLTPNRCVCPRAVRGSLDDYVEDLVATTVVNLRRRDR